MIALRTQWTRTDLLAAGSLRTLRIAIEASVPLSAGKHNTSLTETARPRVDELEGAAQEIGLNPGSYAPNWRLQLGSLGSGNHFIEITVDETDAVSLFLHAGSRGVGNKIAQRHIAAAAARCRRERIDLPDRDLAFLVEGTGDFDAYMRELHWAQDFALLNREEMMDRVVQVVSDHMGHDVEEHERVSCRHNFTAREGALRQRGLGLPQGCHQGGLGDMGLIPGSMGTASYVVEGKGDPLSLCSSPHGAGRNHSRTAARRLFTREQLARRCTASSTETPRPWSTRSPPRTRTSTS